MKLLESNIEEATKQLEYDFLKGCVTDFFDNEGFKAKGESRRSASRHRKDKQGYTDIVEMLFNYMREKNISGEFHGKAAAISDDYIEKCSALYSAALREKYSKAFIPLYFDSDSGAGIFIVGKDRFKDELTRDCTVCIIYFSSLDDQKDNISEYNEVLIDMLVERCDTVEKAFYDFSRDILSDKYFENYTYVTEQAFCTSGIDEIFKPRLRRSDEEIVKISDRDKKIIEAAKEDEERVSAILREKGR